MDARFTVAQVTGALPNNEPAKVVKLTKPQTDQAITVHLDGTSKLDLTAIGNENVTFVHAGDRLVILFDNHSTVTIEPFYDSRGLPLADISVELSPDRSVSGVEFASLFPITTDQSILPAAGGTSSPASGANFETVDIDQFAGNPVPLALLTPNAPAGSGGPTNSSSPAAVNLQTQGPVLGVHDAAGNEDRPIALGITDALSIADPRASLGSLTIIGVPAGATLSAGTHNADGSWTLTPAQLAGLTLTSDGEVQHFALTVRGTTIDGGITDVSTATVNVSITPVADTPTLTIGASGLTATVSGNEDKAIALPIQTALGEADADAVLSVTITGVPAGAILSAGIHNADGSWTLTPAQLAGLTLTGDGEAQHFDLTVTATTTDGGDAATAASTPGTFHVNVAPVPETPTLDPIVTPASINEGTTIALNLVPHFEVDADATNTIVVSGLPSGATLNHGSFDASTGNYKLSQADLVGLTLSAPDNDTKQISFTVTAHASEGGIDAASSTQQVTLAVNPVAEAPVLTATAAAASVNEDSTVALNIAVAPAESDADATTSVTISGLGTATLTNAAGGTFSGDTVTFTQAQLNAGALNGLTLHAADDDTASLHLTVTASTNDAGSIAPSAPQTINLTVNPVADAPVLTATAAAASVNEDSTVALNINVTAESDADATTSVTISGLGTATLTNAAGSTFSGDTVTFTQAQLNAGALDGLTLHAADDDTASLHLTVTASTNDAGSIATSAPQTINLTVNPVADAPTLTTSQLAFQPVAFDVSGATLTEAFGVNGQGTIVGLFEDSSHAFHGFVDNGGVTTTFDAPGSTLTEVTGINDNRDIVGLFFDKSSAEHGFLETSTGTFSQIDVNGASATLAFGINDSGTIVGRFVDASGQIHGFSEQNGAFTQIDVSLAGDTTITATRALGINNNGQIVGLFDDASGEHGFVDTNGLFKAIDVPGATKTNARGIDANGDIVGVYDDALGEHGFFLSANGVFTTINGGAGTFTDALGINASGEVVGDFVDVTGTHGFSAVGSLLSSNTVSGREDFPIALGIKASLSEVDADAALKITISGLPSGVSLSDANNDSLSIVNGSITLTPAELVGLALTSDGETQNFDLTVTATTVDGGDTATAATSSATLHVNVTPAADAPTLTLPTSHVLGNEDQPIALGINAALGEIDKDAVLLVAISGLPSGVSLSDANGDFLPITNGSITLTPAELAGLKLTSDGEVQHFDLTVTAITIDGGNSSAGTSGTLHVDVTPVPSSAPTLTVTLPSAPPATIDASIPGTTVTSTQVTDINDAGHVVGLYRDAAGTHVFEDINGTFTPITILPGPPSSITVAVGINSSDQIVGNFTVGGQQHGFLDTNGHITQIDDPSAVNVTLATGINDSGEIVGLYRDAGLKIHGFLDINGQFTTLDVPSSLQSIVNNPQTRAFGINNAGEVVGFFQDFTGQTHGFLFNNGKYTTIDAPGATLTEATGINNAGAIVGFFTDASGHTHGFLDNNGQFTTIDVPGATTTEALGINDRGQISGFFTDANGVNHGFVSGVSGKEDTAIALPINATLSSAETDPDTVLTVTISGLPSGVTLSDNNHDIITITNGTATLTAAELNGLALISDGETQHFDLTVTATNTDGGDALTAISTPSQLIHVDVAPVATPPALTASNVTVTEGGTATLHITDAPGEIDPDASLGNVTISGIPAGFMLLDANGHALAITGGSVTVTPAQLAGLQVTVPDTDQGNFTLHVTATATDGFSTATSSQDIHVTAVAPGAVLLFGADHTTLLGEFTSIQSAVDAAKAPGEFVDITSGTYKEQVVVDPSNGHGANGLTIEGAPGASVTVLAPGTLVKTGATLSGSHDIDGIFTVNNASNVTFHNLTINGQREGSEAFFMSGQNNPELVGIAMLNSNGGTINGVTVTGIRESDAGIGDQRNVGILALNTDPSGGGVPTDAQIAGLNTLSIVNSTIQDFQKGAIVVSAANVHIDNNTVIGVGDVNQAQNGIQVSGSTGDISSNSISNIGFINPSAAATGVLAFDNDRLTINGNSFTGALDANNNVLGSTVGIFVLDSSNGTITNNQSHLAEDGIVGQSFGTVGLTGIFLVNGNTSDGVPMGGNGLFFDPNPTEATTSSVFTITGTNAPDVLAVSPGIEHFTGGTGNDTFLVENAAFLTAADTLIGGSGHNNIAFASTITNDTLVVGTNVSNVQEIDLVDPNTFAPDNVAKNVDASALTTGLTIVGNNAADIIAGSAGNDTITGGSGLDTAVYKETLAASNLTFDSVHNNWVVTTASEGTDTLHGISKVADGTTVATVAGGTAGHEFLLVGGGGSQFATIQQAVNAAHAGDTILIAPGTYTEQVSVVGKNNLTIEGIGPAGSVILDAPATSNLQSVTTPSTPEFTPESVAGLITVSNATGVTIQGLTINGLHTDVSPNSTDYAGVAFVNGSGTVDHVDITGIRDTNPLFGLQRGFGIEAVNGTAGQTITVTNSSIEDFQKGGIVSDNVNVEINHDTFTGVGATSLIAQNAIQVSDASGDISNNNFAGVGYIPTTDDSTDILFFHDQNLTIDNNIINGALDGNGNPVSDIGIAGLNSSNVTINGNQISNVQEAILGQEDANFGGGVFAPPWSIGNSNVIIKATQQGLDFEVASTDTQSFNIVGTSSGNDLFVGGAGNDTFTSGGSGNDTFVYNVANHGTQTSIGGTGIDTEIVNGSATATTYNINPISSGTELGIHIESGTAPANVVVATVANAQVTTQAIEEIVLNLGNAGDKVILSGDLSGTGVATHTITINGGTGDDTVDLSQLASNEDVVFSGGGHGANGDTAILGFAFGAATYQGIFDTSGDLIGVNITHNSADGPVTDTFTNLQNFNFTDGSRSLTELIPTLTVTAQFDPTNDVLNLNSQTIATSTANETVELTDAGHPGATLNASGDQFTASGINETLDLSGWDRAVEIDFAAGTIRLDANSLTQSGSISGFANVVGTTHNDSFDNLTGSVTVTGGAGAVDHFGLAANVLSSSSIPTITNYSSSSGETIDLSALLDAKFGPGSDPTKAANFVEVKEDAGGNSATLEINLSGASGGTFVAAAHLGGVHSGDLITAILDHAHTTAQLHAA